LIPKLHIDSQSKSEFFSEGAFFSLLARRHFGETSPLMGDPYVFQIKNS
jgi:hypothetical protein